LVGEVYGIAKSTPSNIGQESFEVIFKHLKSLVFMKPTTLKIKQANDFRIQNFALHSIHHCPKYTFILNFGHHIIIMIHPIIILIDIYVDTYKHECNTFALMARFQS
jgi:hypothetical protein